VRFSAQTAMNHVKYYMKAERLSGSLRVVQFQWVLLVCTLRRRRLG